MLECPKCRNTYEDGSHRFCPVEGSRLLPLKSENEVQKDKPQGVFTNLLNRQPPVQTEEAPAPRYTPVRRTKPIVFEPVSQPKVFKSEPPKAAQTISEPKTFAKPHTDNSVALKPSAQYAPVERKTVSVPVAARTTSNVKIAEGKMPPRLIREEEIPEGTLDVTKSKVNFGEFGFNFWQNPKGFVGQTVKGRYQIKSLKSADEAGFVYFATDNLSNNKKVVLRIFKNDYADDLTKQILAEERVSLSHINHPNIVSLIDSGELTDRTQFIVSEFADGESVADKLNRAGKFDPRRAARIIRQTAYALSEAHQNGVLHRNLKPQNIILTINDAGVELIKVADFAIADGTQNEEDLAYLAPEQVDERPTIFSSDIFSLAVIGYRLLTNRMPFDGDSTEILQGLHRRGVGLKASDLRENIPFGIDGVLEKALAFEPAERYVKARDFGDAFFNELVNPSAVSPETKFSGNQDSTEDKDETVERKQEQSGAKTALKAEVEKPQTKQPEYISFKSPEESGKPEPMVEMPMLGMDKEIIVTEESLWEKRSPEPPQSVEKSRLWIILLGLVVLLAALWGIWQYFLNRPVEPEIETPPAQQTVSTELTGDALSTQTKITEVESVPPARQILQPAETTYFQNKKEDLDAELAKSYRGFSFYYPNGWINSPTKKSFVDVAKKDANGVPIEQMLVSFYESKGTFKGDKEKFPTLVKESNKLLSKQLSNYRFISENAGEINGGWKIYEMKFEAKSVGKNGEPLMIYGRRIFMPSMREGIKTGFMITMLATSLSSDVKNVDDVGTKGGLKTVLETFEPSPIF